MTGRSFTERDIHMALDGELPMEERADFDAWLEANPEMKAKNARFADDSTRLRDALAGVLDEPVPERLMKLARAGRSGKAWWRWQVAVAAAIIFIAGGAAGYLAGSGLPLTEQAEDRLAEQAIGAYVTYTADLPHAVEVDATDRNYLEAWLSKRTGLKLVAPDLSGQGFELLGGRVLPAGYKAAALLVYKDQAGDQISIYVMSEAGEKIRGTYTPAAGGPSAIYWLDKGFGCAIVGAMPQDRLTEAARSAWRQLLAGAAA